MIIDCWPSMRFTKGKSNPHCLKNDHTWEKTGSGFQGKYPVYQCKVCKEMGFVCEGIYLTYRFIYGLGKIGVVPGGTGMRGGAPLVPGVCEMGLIGERGTGLGGIWVVTIP